MVINYFVFCARLRLNDNEFDCYGMMSDALCEFEYSSGCASGRLHCCVNFLMRTRHRCQSSPS